MTPYHFFPKHAGYSYDPKTQTPAQGRIECAKALARAERIMQESGAYVTWEPDPYADDSWMEPGETWDRCECATLRNAEGDALASLGMIFDASPDYQRVVEAELALEAQDALLAVAV